jgi:hypothetical protein
MQTVLKMTFILGISAFILWLLTVSTDKFSTMPLSDSLLYMGLLPWVAAAVILPWVAAAVMIAKRPERAKFDLYLSKKPADADADADASPSHTLDRWITLLVVAGLLPMVAAVVLMNT